MKVNESATKEWYLTSEPWSCDSGDCRNILALCKCNERPEAVHSVLEALNIAPQKAAYVCGMRPKEEGYLYQFSYRITGRQNCRPFLYSFCNLRIMVV